MKTELVMLVKGLTSARQVSDRSTDSLRCTVLDRRRGHPRGS